jgi:YesN/AraC family two-component response regulator
MFILDHVSCPRATSKKYKVCIIALFNYSMSFEELLNKSRVDYFVEIIKEPKYKNFTVEALALEVGFGSRQRFYQPFKKYHGGNPSDLIDILN